MSKKLYEIIKFPIFHSTNGDLSVFESNLEKKGSVPFHIKRVFSITGTRNKESRGAHTHKKTLQVLICLHGSCVVDLDNGKRKKSIVLDKPNEGLVLYPYVWHTMKDFKKDTTLICLANAKYNEKDYIRDYTQFLKKVQ